MLPVRLGKVDDPTVQRIMSAGPKFFAICLMLGGIPDGYDGAGGFTRRGGGSWR